MTELLQTRFSTEFELRGSDGRTVTGLAVPFGVPTSIGGRYSESFNKGSFAKTIKEKTNVRLFAQHDTKTLPLGKATTLREDPEGLWAEFYISHTRAGDEVLELVRDGALDAFSVGFVPIKDAWSKDKAHVERQEVALKEVSLVAFPAYSGAKVAAVRFDADDPELAPRLIAVRNRLLSL